MCLLLRLFSLSFAPPLPTLQPPTLSPPPTSFSLAVDLQPREEVKHMRALFTQSKSFFWLWFSKLETTCSNRITVWKTHFLFCVMFRYLVPIPTLQLLLIFFHTSGKYKQPFFIDRCVIAVYNAAIMESGLTEIHWTEHYNIFNFWPVYINSKQAVELMTFRDMQALWLHYINW